MKLMTGTLAALLSMGLAVNASAITHDASHMAMYQLASDEDTPVPTEDNQGSTGGSDQSQSGSTSSDSSQQGSNDQSQGQSSDSSSSSNDDDDSDYME